MQLDFIINTKSLESENSLIISGIATTNSWDRGSLSNKNSESLTITPNAIKQAWGEGIPVMVDHGKGKEFGTQQIGRWISYLYEPSDYSLDSPELLKMEIKVVCEITNQKAIELINNNKLNNFSLSWKTLNWLLNQKTGQRIDTEIELAELTLTATPANPDAKFTVVTDESLLEQFNLENETRLNGKKVQVKTILENAKMYYAEVIIENQKSMVPISELTEAKKIKLNYKLLDNNAGVSFRPANKLKIMYTELKSKILDVVKAYMPDAEVNEISDLSMKVMPPLGEDGMAEFKVGDKTMRIKLMINGDNMELGDIEEDEVIEKTTEDVAETATEITPNAETAETAEIVEPVNNDSEKSSSTENMVEVENAKSEVETPTVENVPSDTTEGDQSEIENAKTAQSFDDLVNEYGYLTALKIQEGTITI